MRRITVTDLHNRPFRAPRVVRHHIDSELLCMEWQFGQALHQLERIEVAW